MSLTCARLSKGLNVSLWGGGSKEELLRIRSDRQVIREQAGTYRAWWMIV